MVATCSEGDCDSPAKTRGLCNKHYLRWWNSTPKVERSKPVGKVKQPLEDRISRFTESQSNGCLHWTGRVNEFGYGQIKVDGKTRPAHIIVYETRVGPVPVGMELDHTCHSNDLSCRGGDSCLHRRCVNVSHLEPVPRITNLLRSRSFVSVNANKTHCKNGHEFTEENTDHSGGRRSCRTCRKDIWTRANQRKKEERASLKTPRTTCRNGHPWVDDNIYVAPSGLKTCKICTKESQTRYKLRKSKER